jgi:hypothetical protein
MSDELRAMIREVIQDLLPNGLPVTETVNLADDEDLAAFVKRLVDLDPDEREAIRSGRKRFRLPGMSSAARTAQVPAAAVNGTERAGDSPVRRIERGAVTEAMISQAAQAGQRLVLGRGAVLTPLARDRARASGVPIEKER